MRKKKWMVMLAVSMLLAMMFVTTAFASRDRGCGRGH